MRPLLLAGFLACATAVSAAAETVTIDTATGSAELETAPETVVVFDAPSIDTLHALGQPIAGIPQPLYLSGIDDVVTSAETVGTMFEPDFEALAVMQPDLIIAGGRSSAQVEALSQIAPTIDMTIWGEGMVEQTRARIAAFGELFGKQAEAEALTGELDAKLAEAKEAVAGKGTGLIVLTNGGKISAYGANSRFGWLHGALDLPEAHPGLEDDTHGQAISFEFIAETDPDWLLVIDRGAAINADSQSAQATLDNPLVARSKAAQQGHILYLDAAPMYISGGGASSMMHTLDEVIAAFSTSES
ncbi:MAG: siderophore ABC transporter substrate-binding protein [Salipiger thiooxidans]|uniref:siderophore ABC transporter substrate-binding protein n=1 Tax=Salipiger thiooxidans TaxID=282683 RepID=UPI001CF94C46|nr:siderophore ABC transporter substrate-binding protein [Salipiger thiooxidans]